MDPSAPAASNLEKLRSVRLLVLRDPTNYQNALRGLTEAKVISAQNSLEVQRWGAAFLAESLASPMVGADAKQQMALTVLPTIRDYLQNPEQDAAVVKSSIQAATSAYPLIFKYTIYHANDAAAWQTMASIKSNIIHRMDSAPAGVKACCIKFIQRVVQCQTAGLIADPRRPDQNETSLVLVPRDHPLMSPPKLEAEAQGLLDRLLGIFQEAQSDAVLVTATLNSIGGLVRTRPAISSRILNAILNFNPFRLPGNTITSRMRVVSRSMERTVRAFLLNFTKRNPTHPFAGRVMGYLERLAHSRLETVEESRKRGAPSDPNDGFDVAKRQRLDADAPSGMPMPFGSVPPLPPGPVTVAQLYTLTTDEGMKGFSAESISADVISRIIVPIFQIIDQGALDNAVNAVRSRYLSLQSPKSAADIAMEDRAAAMANDSLDIPDDESLDAEMVLNAMDRHPVATDRPPEADDLLESDLALGPYTIPQPEPLSEDDADALAKDAIARVFGMVSAAEEPSKTNALVIAKQGLNRLAASSYDRHAWITIAVRLATRPFAGLTNSSGDGDVASAAIKAEDPDLRHSRMSSADTIRNTILQYVLADFRKRIDVAISWLNEEWYNERIAGPPVRAAANGGGDDDDDYDDENDDDDGDDNSTAHPSTPTYEAWTLKLLDSLSPFLDARDKCLTILVSELPALTPGMLERVKRLASDPERVGLAVSSLHYLALFRPPARELALDKLQEVHGENEYARGMVGKVLAKFRPEAMAAAAAPGGTEGADEQQQQQQQQQQATKQEDGAGEDEAMQEESEEEAAAETGMAVVKTEGTPATAAASAS